MLFDAANHLPVHERRGRRVPDFQLDAARMPHDLDIEVRVALQDFLGVVGVVAGVEHRQRALAKQAVQAALAGIQELGDLLLGQILEAAARRDQCVDRIRDDDTVGVFTYGRISMGASGGVISQISSMSESETAMQPSVQSRFS